MFEYDNIPEKFFCYLFCSERILYTFTHIAERKTSCGKDWHSACLRCERCSKTLTPGGHAVREDKPYCHTPCYATLFGPSGMCTCGFFKAVNFLCA